MVKPVVNRLLFVSLVCVVFALSACGINTSGEPQIVQEREILPAPTRAVQLPTPPPLNPTSAAPTAAAPPQTGDVVLSEEIASADFNLGMETYLAECAACHGAASGAGPSLSVIQAEAGSRVEGLSAEEYVLQSIVDPGAFLVPDYADIMPKDYAERLSQEQIRALVRFIFEFSPPGMAARADDEDGAEAPAVAETTEVVDVTGRLVQGTAGGRPIPADQPVSLFVLDGTGAELLSRETTASAEKPLI